MYISQNSGSFSNDPERAAHVALDRRRSWLSLKARQTAMSEEPESLTETTPLNQPHESEDGVPRRGTFVNKKGVVVDASRKRTLGWDGTRPAMSLPLYILFEVSMRACQRSEWLLIFPLLASDQPLPCWRPSIRYDARLRWWRIRPGRVSLQLAHEWYR